MSATNSAARRYARAAFELARETGQLEAVHGDLASLGDLLESSPELLAFITNPVVPTDRMIAGLDALIKPHVCELTYRFLLFLESRDRLDLIAEICAAFDDAYLQEQGIVRVQITAAIPLTDPQIAGIVDAMRLRLGKEPQATVNTDPDLIGGFRVRAGDTIYDYSIATQLDSLKKRIISA